MNIAENIRKLRSSIPGGVSLVAVSKFHPEDAIREAYGAGQRIFGESRVQELVEKRPDLPADIKWHFIGPLQTNKVKAIAPFIHTIQSIDTVKLLKEVDKQAARNERIINVLLEIHIAKEESKHGFSRDECLALFNEPVGEAYPNLHFCGLMGMATNTDNMEQVRQEFHDLHQFFETVKSLPGVTLSHFQTLSMGMTHDYRIAIEEGSTMIRIGTMLFGEREY